MSRTLSAADFLEEVSWALADHENDAATTLARIIQAYDQTNPDNEPTPCDGFTALDSQRPGLCRCGHVSLAHLRDGNGVAGMGRCCACHYPDGDLVGAARERGARMSAADLAAFEALPERYRVTIHDDDDSADLFRLVAARPFIEPDGWYDATA